MSLFLLPLSLSEASGTFVGLEAQALVRAALGPAPILVILSGASFIVLGYVRRQRTLTDLGVYLFASLLTLALVWPTTASVSPSDVQAQAAAGQPVNSAAQLLPDRGALQIPQLEVNVLQAITSMWVDVGRAINVEGDRPFSEVAPISWLMQQRLQAQTSQLIRDWTSACIMPARKQLLETGTSIGYEALLPFPGSALHGVMSTLTRQVGDGTQNCGALSSTILAQVGSEVASLVSPAGNAMSTIWSAEIGLTPDEVVQFLIMREVTRASGPEIQPTSLVGLYSGVRATRSLTGGLFNTLKGAANLSLGDTLAGIAGVLSGGATDALSDLTLGIETLVGRALFVTKFSSDIVGVLQAVILSVFPLVALVALAPGKQLTVLVSYLYLLIAVYSMPVAWSLIDLLSDIALTSANIGGLVTDPVITLEAYSSALIIVTVGTWVALFGLAFAILLPVAGGAVGVIRGVRGL